jgi:hypothetical protein
MGADVAKLALELAGWRNIRAEEWVGAIRVDAVAETANPEDPISVIFEVTYGIDEEDRPGLIRTDNLKKIISDAYILRKQDAPAMPYVILTSHLPRAGGKGNAWLGIALGDVIDAVLVLPAIPALREMAKLSEPEFELWLFKHQMQLKTQLGDTP